MPISQKSQYALRALFELAKRYDSGPAKISEVAAAQHIPTRFLEVILNELKQGGFTDSRRGKEGGYFLARLPRDITVGEVLRFVEGPLHPLELPPSNTSPDPHQPGAVLLPMWAKAERALADIYDKTTLRDLLDDEKRMRESWVPDYMI